MYWEECGVSVSYFTLDTNRMPGHLPMGSRIILLGRALGCYLVYVWSVWSLVAQFRPKFSVPVLLLGGRAGIVPGRPDIRGHVHTISVAHIHTFMRLGWVNDMTW
jgi:hypothetical protein